MPLRSQQQELKQIVEEIAAGVDIDKIYLFWAPGGGKSLAPVILSDLLINNKKQLWVVPRNSLKEQGESDYTNDIYPVNKACRIADNSGDPWRGCEAAVTTYQAIGSNPEKWIQIFKDNDVMLVLDEYHHLSGHGDWIKTINELESNSFLSVFMTGTPSRGDKTMIPLTPYMENMEIDLRNTRNRRFIIYSREQALKDKSILPFESHLIDGSGKYIDREGFERSFDSFGISGDHLRCALTSDYAYHLLDLVVSHWLAYKKINHFSKLLIVSPNIKTAREYNDYLSNKYSDINTGIATSDDSKECRDNIKRYKKDNAFYQSLNCLVTVGVAYEGFSVKQISHMGILTLIRSREWLEQCVARAARNYPNKTMGYIYAPKDPRMVKALKDISGGYLIIANGEPQEKQSKPKEDDEERSGTPQGIEALESQAHINGVPLFSPPPQEQHQHETQSEKEQRLRKEINSVINRIVGSESAGNRKVKERVFWLKVKRLVNKGRDTDGKLIRKPLKEFSIPELEKVAEFAKTY